MEILQTNEPVANAAPVEPVVAPTEPKATANEPAPTLPKDDLLRRVSEFQADNAPENKSPEEIDTEFFSDPKLREHINKVEDPEIKAQLLAMRRSGISGISGKMQEIAELRKDLEALKIAGNRPVQEKWTKDRIAMLAKDPDFVQAAREYQSAEVGTDQNGDFDENTQVMFNKMQKEIDDLKNINKKTVDNQSRAYQVQEHSRLQAKYPDYDPSTVDTITFEMIENKRSSVTPGSSVYEDIYKAANYEKNVERAYKLGRQDEREGTTNAPPAMNGITTRPSDPSITPEPEESNQNFLRRIIDKNLKAAKMKTTI